MKEFNIKITDTDVYINGVKCEFTHDMDPKYKDDDLDMKAILALSEEMGYDTVDLFEGMLDRLYWMMEQEDAIVYMENNKKEEK